MTIYAGDFHCMCAQSTNTTESGNRDSVSRFSPAGAITAVAAHEDVVNLLNYGSIPCRLGIRLKGIRGGRRVVS
jgi:hypothetical protein